MSTGKGYFNRLIQVSTMTTDTEGYQKQLEHLFGWTEPNGLKLEENEFTQYYGKPELMESYFSFYPVKGIAFEIVQPRKGKNIWQDYANEFGHGLHHIAFDVDDFDAVHAHLTKQGVKSAQTGISGRFNGARWA